MIVLDQPTKKCEVTLAGAVTTNQLDVNAYYFDQYPQVQSQPRSGHNYTATNSTTDVTAVAAPALAGIRRNIHTFSCYNKDTAAAIVTVKIDDGGSERILVKQTLSAGDSLNYEHGAGWTFTTAVSAPFTDTTNLVKGSSDATKQLRFEVDNFTTATTRVWTMPNGDINLASATANTVLAGPTSGSATSATMRALVGADGASLVLIEAQSVSSAAAATFTSGISSTYDAYVLACTKVIPQTDNSDFRIQLSADGGSTWLAGTYAYARTVADTAGGVTGNGAASADQWVPAAALGTNTGEVLNMVLTFQNLADTSVYKGAHGTGQLYDQAASFKGLTFSGQVNSTSAINALRAIQSSGNISGQFALYGVRKA